MKFLGNDASAGKYVDPPTNVSASAGNAQATVSFTAATYDGKSTATYIATSSPGSLTASGSSSPLVVTGLSNGTSYTFTVTTVSGYGVNAVSSSSNSVTPEAPPPSFPPTFDPCAGVTCGDCNNTTGYTYTGDVYSYSNPFGNCTGCSGTVYAEYQPAGALIGCCAALACFLYCDDCYSPPPSFGPSFAPSFGPSFPPSFPPYFSNT